MNHKLESLQVSSKDQISISRLRSCHHPDLKYWLHKICRALDISVINEVWGRRQSNTKWGSALESTTLNPTCLRPTPSKPWRCGSCERQNLIFYGFHNQDNSHRPSVQLFAQQHQKSVVVREIVAVVVTFSFKYNDIGQFHSILFLYIKSISCNSIFEASYRLMSKLIEVVKYSKNAIKSLITILTLYWC